MTPDTLEAIAGLILSAIAAPLTVTLAVLAALAAYTLRSIR